MSEEIKFRGKRADNGEWVYGYYFKDFTGESYIIDSLQDIENADPTNVWVKVNPETVGQYTGLNDKNGVEICEGDIIKTCPSTYCQRNDGDKPKIKVIKDRLFFDICIRGLYIKTSDYYKVIGNIYENKELIECTQ